MAIAPLELETYGYCWLCFNFASEDDLAELTPKGTSPLHSLKHFSHHLELNLKKIKGDNLIGNSFQNCDDIKGALCGDCLEIIQSHGELVKSLEEILTRLREVLNKVYYTIWKSDQGEDQKAGTEFRNTMMGGSWRSIIFHSIVERLREETAKQCSKEIERISRQYPFTPENHVSNGQGQCATTSSRNLNQNASIQGDLQMKMENNIVQDPNANGFQLEESNFQRDSENLLYHQNQEEANCTNDYDSQMFSNGEMSIPEQNYAPPSTSSTCRGIIMDMEDASESTTASTLFNFGIPIKETGSVEGGRGNLQMENYYIQEEDVGIVAADKHNIANREPEIDSQQQKRQQQQQQNSFSVATATTSVISSASVISSMQCSSSGLVIANIGQKRQCAPRKYRRVRDKNKIKCPHCPFYAKGRMGYSQHVSKLHISVDEKVKCGICESAFLHEQSLRCHLNQYHTFKHYKCPECGKGFKWKLNLMKHVESICKKRK